MIYAFKRGKIAFGTILGLSLVITVLIWQRDRNYPVIVPVIATVLMLAIGVVVGRLAGNILASSENTKYLGYLHMELDPEKFIRCYREIPEKVKGEATAAICRSYLADGYGAAGDYDEAIRLLRVAPPADNWAVQGLYAANLAQYLLAKQDARGAEDALQELNRIIDACRLNKADLAGNLISMQTLHTQHLRCLQGKPVDVEELELAFSRAQYNLRRLEIAKVLALTAIRDADEAAKKKQLSFLRKNGGLTVYKRWADQQK